MVYGHKPRPICSLFGSRAVVQDGGEPARSPADGRGSGHGGRGLAHLAIHGGCRVRGRGCGPTQKCVPFTVAITCDMCRLGPGSAAVMSSTRDPPTSVPAAAPGVSRPDPFRAGPRACQVVGRRTPAITALAPGCSGALARARPRMREEGIDLRRREPDDPLAVGLATGEQVVPADVKMSRPRAQRRLAPRRRHFDDAIEKIFMSCSALQGLILQVAGWWQPRSAGVELDFRCLRHKQAAPSAPGSRLGARPAFRPGISRRSRPGPASARAFGKTPCQD